jgi:outer membrane lipoprotein LolB
MFFNRLRTVAIVGILLSFLNACSSLQPKSGDLAMSDAVDWQHREQLIQAVREWDVSGRIAMRTDNDAWSASMKWKQAQDNYDIELFGPLGGRVVSIEGGKHYVSLTNDEGKTYTEINATQLIQRHTGWQMPVEDLRYWARAIAAPGSSAEYFYDESGRLSGLHQSGWVIEYQDYQLVEGLLMPRKLRLSNRHFTLKMLFRNWQFQASAGGI